MVSNNQAIGSIPQLTPPCESFTTLVVMKALADDQYRLQVLDDWGEGRVSDIGIFHLVNPRFFRAGHFVLERFRYYKAANLPFYLQVA